METLSQFSNEIFIVAKSKEQVLEYMKNVDISNILAFIVDDNKILQDVNDSTPMLGLYSTFKELKKLQYEKVCVLSCDNPMIQPQVIKLLLQDCDKYDCCIPRWDNGFLEPLIAVYPIKKAFKRSKKYLLLKDFKVTNIIDQYWHINYVSIEQSIKRVDPNLLSFKNLNENKHINELEDILNKTQ
jgi:molybdopterin-guanine dinucleotide biosynthesis protein A